MSHKNATFGSALELIRWNKGHKMTREGWNGAGQFVFFQQGYPDGIAINQNTAEATGIAQGTVCKLRPHLMLCTVQGDFVPWVPSISDILSDDWEVFE